jgi:hypothetical protein
VEEMFLVAVIVALYVQLVKTRLTKRLTPPTIPPTLMTWSTVYVTVTLVVHEVMVVFIATPTMEPNAKERPKRDETALVIYTLLEVFSVILPVMM